MSEIFDFAKIWLELAFATSFGISGFGGIIGYIFGDALFHSPYTGAFIGFIICGYINWGDDGCFGIWYRFQPKEDKGYADFRKMNQLNLAKIEVGMSKENVFKIFGNREYRGMSNPFKSEFIPSKDGKVEVVYYYTDCNSNNGKGIYQSMTPIIFKDNMVVGWGHQILDDLNIR
jgi:hypothetical protein